ncbi:MAG: response regulator [Planctomycetota bacterium]
MQLLEGKVLVAEDGSDNRKLIDYLLRGYGIEPDIASNGIEAIDMVTEAIAEAEPYDLVLMDMQMPEMDGYEATRELRRRNVLSASGKRMPIVSLTAAALDGDRIRCLNAGCDKFLAKPIDKLELQQVLSEYLSAAADADEPTMQEVIMNTHANAFEQSDEVLRSTYDGDESMQELIDIYTSELPGYVAQLIRLQRNAVSEPSAALDLRRLCHQLKGSGGGYGFAAITATAAKAETAAAKAGFKSESSVIKAMNEAVEQLIAVMRRIENYDQAAEAEALDGHQDDSKRDKNEAA